jgi:hypothetical protein
MGLLDHKTAVITGANSGIGWRPRRDLLPKGPTGCSLPVGGNPN